MTMDDKVAKAIDRVVSKEPSKVIRAEPGSSVNIEARSAAFDVILVILLAGILSLLCVISWRLNDIKLKPSPEVHITCGEDTNCEVLP